MREPERAVDPTLTKEFQKLLTAASKCAEVCSNATMHSCACMALHEPLHVHLEGFLARRAAGRITYNGALLLCPVYTFSATLDRGGVQTPSALLK